MPNGDDSPKNWWRLCILCQDFKNRHGHFPTSATLGSGAVEDILFYLPESKWREVNTKLPIVTDESDPWRIEVSDGEGRALSYGDSALDGENREAVMWLGQFIHLVQECPYTLPIKPDRLPQSLQSGSVPL